jgi:hypothetical protein
VFERFTDQARHAIVRAQVEARRLGDATIDPGHLLLGVVAVDRSIAQLALARLGVTADALREARSASGSASPDGHIPFDAGTKAALECALRESIADRSLTLTTGHLLLGVMGELPSAVRPAAPSVERSPTGAGLSVSTVDGAAVDVEAVRAAVIEEHRAGRSPESAGPVWRDLHLAPGPDRLPWSSVPATVLAILWYAGLSAAILGLTWDEAGPEIFGTVFVASTVIYGLLVALVSRRGTAKHLAKLPVAFDPPPEVVAVLARRGLTGEIRLQSGRAVRDRCYRRGSNAWIVLAPRTMARPRLVGFVLAHEVAHALRNDHGRHRVVGTLAPATLVAGYITLDPWAWLIAFSGVIVFHVADRWWSELACDRFAVRWAGAAALRAWADDHRALLRERQNRGWRRLRRVRNLLKHPPFALRVALYRNRQSPSR